MSTTTTNFGWTVPSDTDLVKDGAAAIRTALGGVDTSFVDLKGGTTGQVLSKASGTDLDFAWVAQDDSNAIQNAIVDAKGDLIAATGADTPARLPVGTNGYVLTADSTASTGLAWAAVAAGGKVKQVVQGSTTTSVVVSSTTLTDTGLTASITPSATSSKILVMISQSYYNGCTNASNVGSGINLLRNTTDILTMPQFSQGYFELSGNTQSKQLSGYTPLFYLDSPSTTSSVTYKLQGSVWETTGTKAVQFQWNNMPSTITLIEIGA